MSVLYMKLLPYGIALTAVGGAIVHVQMERHRLCNSVFFGLGWKGVLKHGVIGAAMGSVLGPLYPVSPGIVWWVYNNSDKSSEYKGDGNEGLRCG